MTPTVQMLADVALPVAMCVEKLGMIAKRTGAFAMSPIAGLKIEGEPKSDAEIVWLLGKRFNEKDVSLPRGVRGNIRLPCRQLRA